MEHHHFIATLSITNTIGIGIIGFDHIEDKVKFCWMKDGREEKVSCAALHHSLTGHPFFKSKGQRFYLADFIK